jgi:outer membrane protein assembly factor BamB
MSLVAGMRSGSAVSRVAAPVGCRAKRTKLDARRWGVNSTLLALTITLALAAACHPPRVVPAVPPGRWVSALGDGERAAYARERIDGELNVVWRKGIDRGFAAPIQVHGPVLIATTTGRSIVTLNTQSGMQYWSRRFSGPIAGTALRSDDMLFVATGDRDNRVHAINISRGRGIWSKRVGTIRVEPLLIDDAIIAVTEAGEVIALRTQDGTQLWRTSLPAAPAVPPVRAGNALLVATQRDTLYRIDAVSGRVDARLALPGTPSAPALVHGGMVIYPVYASGVIAIAPAADMRLLWSAEVAAPILAAPVVSHGAIHVLDANAGVWRIDAGGATFSVSQLGGAASGSFTAVGDDLVVGRLDGSLFVIDRNGRVVETLDLGDSVIAPVAAGEGALWVCLLRGDLVKLQ